MKLRAQQYDHIKRFNRQMLAKKGALDEEAKTSIKQGITGNIAEVDGNPQTDVVAMPYPPLQTDIYAVQNAVIPYRDNLHQTAVGYADMAWARMIGLLR